MATPLTSAPSTTSGSSNTGVELFNLQVSTLVALTPATLDKMATTMDATEFNKLVEEHYRICIADVHLDLIKPHPLQRPIDMAHAQGLATKFSPTHGPDFTNINNYIYVVASGPEWNNYYHRFVDPIKVTPASGLKALCVSGDHRIAALRIWCEANNAPEKLYWRCVVLSQDFDQANPLMIRNYITSQNSLSTHLVTAPNELMELVIQFAASAYAENNPSAIPSMLRGHNITPKDTLGRLTTYPDIVQHLAPLIPLFKHYVDWSSNRDIFLTTILQIKSSKVACLYLDIIHHNLTAIHEACVKHGKFLSGFSLGAAPVNISSKMAAPNKQFTGHYNIKYTGGLVTAKRFYDSEALEFLIQVFGNEIDEGGVFENGLNVLFYTPQTYTKNKEVKTWADHQVSVVHAICYTISPPEMYIKALNQAKPYSWPLPAANYVDGLLDDYLNKHDVQSGFASMLKDHDFALYEDWIRCTKVENPSIIRTHNEDSELDLGKRITQTLLTQSKIWYELLVAMGIQPGHPLPCTAAFIGLDATLIMPVLHPWEVRKQEALEKAKAQKRVEETQRIRAEQEAESAKLLAEKQKTELELELRQKKLAEWSENLESSKDSAKEAEEAVRLLEEQLKTAQDKLQDQQQEVDTMAREGVTLGSDSEEVQNITSKLAEVEKGLVELKTLTDSRVAAVHSSDMEIDGDALSFVEFPNEPPPFHPITTPDLEDTVSEDEIAPGPLLDNLSRSLELPVEYLPKLVSAFKRLTPEQRATIIGEVDLYKMMVQSIIWAELNRDTEQPGPSQVSPVRPGKKRTAPGSGASTPDSEGLTLADVMNTASHANANASGSTQADKGKKRRFDGVELRPRKM